MRTSVYFFIFSFIFSIVSNAQTNFSMKIIDEKIELVRSKKDKKIYSFKVESKIPQDTLFDKYTVIVKANPTKSSLPLSEFEVDFRETILSNLKKTYDFYLTIYPNAEIDRQRLIQLDIIINSKIDPEIKNINNELDSLTFTIKVNPIEPDTALNQYNYLAYIGTNFDLVDGIKAKNLFFATNIHKLPKVDDKSTKNDVGFNLILYGNRTLTTTEDLGRQLYSEKYVPILNTQTARVYKSEGKLTESRVSDNLGAAFSPIFNIANLGNSNRTFQLLYAPQIEFIWRRYSVTKSYTEIIPKDSSEITTWRGGNDVFFLTPPSTNSSSNIYDVNLGLFGGFLSHETKLISVRFQVVGGYSFRYTNQRLISPRGGIDTEFEKKENFFFGARLWITEPISGITLGAELSNNLFKNYQPFYNVTLSKALSFKNIGTIFAPVTSR